MRSYELNLAEALRSPLTSVADLREIAVGAATEHPRIAEVAREEIDRRTRIEALPRRA